LGRSIHSDEVYYFVSYEKGALYRFSAQINYFDLDSVFIVFSIVYNKENEFNLLS
jgi:hypothetical protein